MAVSFLRNPVAYLGLLLLIGLGACEGKATTQEKLPPIIFIPGYGMGALHVEAERKGRPPANFAFLLPAMNPSDVFAKFSPPRL